MHDPEPFERRAPRRRRHPPAFNVPTVILVMIGGLAIVHAFLAEILGEVAATRLIVDLAFFPGCYDAADRLCQVRSAGADVWSPVTYALLHGSWTHLAVNAVWLLAFGTPVARRIGTGRFLAFCVGGAVAGALMFFLANPALVVPVIGASGVVSALMGGACRFAFGGRDATGFRPGHPNLPIVSVGEALANRTVLIFIAVFFGTNLLVGSGFGGGLGGSDVAWEAHLGGFVFGFLAFSLFDPRGRSRGW